MNIVMDISEVSDVEAAALMEGAEEALTQLGYTWDYDEVGPKEFRIINVRKEK